VQADQTAADYDAIDIEDVGRLLSSSDAIPWAFHLHGGFSHCAVFSTSSS
jgi:hypothetical protein